MNEENMISFYNTRFHSRDRWYCIIAIVLLRTLTSQRYYVGRAHWKLPDVYLTVAFRPTEVYICLTIICATARAVSKKKKEKIHFAYRPIDTRTFSRRSGCIIQKEQRDVWTFDVWTMPSAFAGVSTWFAFASWLDILFWSRH